MMAVATVIGAALWAGHDLKFSPKVEGILPGDEVRLTKQSICMHAERSAA